MINYQNKYNRIRIFIISIVLIFFHSCGLHENTVSEEFQAVEKGIWGWKQTKTFSFEIDDTTHYYNIYCGLRITGKYNYSNIWLIYELSENKLENTSFINSTITPLLKTQFQIELADQTGRWLGDGMSNLISFEQPLLLKTKLRKGNYTFKLSHNMREDLISGVNDVGIKVEKGQFIL